jgi:nucleotide-binding universal stress UspA family protein
MRSIVVPVNFSPNSANAARYAADLALLIGAEIHLIYVFDIPISASEIPMPAMAYENLRNGGLELLQGLTQELTTRTFGKVKIQSDIETNGIERRIKEYCDSTRPFLVVAGSSGNSLENMLAGNHTTGLIRHLNYPLLVIPGNASFKTVRKILVAFDREDIFGAMPATLPFLKELSELMGSQLEIIHVLTTDEESAAEAALEYNGWKDQVGFLSPEIHFIRKPHVGEGITAYLNNHQADWLMVFPKDHSWLEFHRSGAKEIVQHSSVPVISVHE